MSRNHFKVCMHLFLYQLCLLHFISSCFVVRQSIMVLLIKQTELKIKACLLHIKEPGTFCSSGKQRPLQPLEETVYRNSLWVYEHLHHCDKEEHDDAAAEGRSTSLLLLWGVALFQLPVHKTQWDRVDLMILHSVRNTKTQTIRKKTQDEMVMSVDVLKYATSAFQFHVNPFNSFIYVVFCCFFFLHLLIFSLQQLLLQPSVDHLSLNHLFPRRLSARPKDYQVHLKHFSKNVFAFSGTEHYIRSLCMVINILWAACV